MLSLVCKLCLFGDKPLLGDNAMDREKPTDDPRKKTDPETFKQTDEPWKGNVEKDQPKGKKHDLEKWKDSETH
jgi:hypothetical protein